MTHTPSPETKMADEPHAAYTVDYLGCEYLGCDIKRIEAIAAAGSKGPTEVVYLYAGQPPETREVCDLSDTELLDELRKRRHRFSPDEYMSQDQCDDRAKLGVLRSAIVDLWKQDPTDRALSTLHSLCDTLDSCYGNPLPARAFAVNTTLPGREDSYGTHQSDMPVAAVDVWR